LFLLILYYNRRVARPNPVAIAKGFVKALFAGDTSRMEARLVSPTEAAVLVRLGQEVEGRHGAFQKQLGARRENVRDLTFVFVACQFEKATLDIQLIFDQAGKVSCMVVRPPLDKLLSR
jgi:hypothetical protein